MKVGRYFGPSQPRQPTRDSPGIPDGQTAAVPAESSTNSVGEKLAEARSELRTSFGAQSASRRHGNERASESIMGVWRCRVEAALSTPSHLSRSEEHTSELQSR